MDIAPKESRFNFIDLLKGFGIFLVVWGHTMTPRSVYIYSFHMPLFFFLSGYVHKDKSFKNFFLSKVNTLYVPYVIFTLISWVYYLGRHILYGRYASINGHIWKLKSIITGTADNGGNNPIWFLTCIFVVSLIFLLLTQKVKKPAVICLIVMAMSLAGYLLYISRVKLYFYCDVAFSGIVFYYLGYWVKQKEYVNYIPRMRNWMFIAGVSILEALHIATAYLNTHIASISRVNMAGNLLGNYFLFYLSAFLGITVCLLLSYKIQSLPILNYLGMNTLIILAFHKPLLQIINNITRLIFATDSLVYGFAASVFAIALSLAANRFLNRNIPQLVGRKPLFI